MKKLFAIAAALAPLTAASPALAAGSTYSVTGTVTAICSAASTGTLDFGTGGLADTTTGALTTSTKSSTDATAICNGNTTKLTVSHQAMQTAATTAVTGFTNTINFTPRVTVNGTDFDADRTNTNIGPFSSMIVSAVNLTTAGSAKPIAGSYNVVNTGTITLTLTPGP